MTLSVLAIAGVVLSQVESVSGERGGTLRAVSIDPVGNLDPAQAQTAFAASLLAATDRTPYAFEPLRGVVPDLALGPPQISNDSRRLEIQIRSGVRFGPPVDRPVTADDIAYAIERGFLPSVSSSFAENYFHSIKGVAAFRAGQARRISGLQTPDDHTLVFNLKEPNARVIASALTLPIAAPVPREYASRFDRGRTSTYARHQVATGPYRFTPGPGGLAPGPSATRYSLERNPNWSRDTDFRQAFVNRIRVVSAPGRGTAANQVVEGSDAISGDFSATAGVLHRTLSDHPSQVTLTDAGALRYASLNTTDRPLRNADVRRALTAAFDRVAARTSLGGSPAGEIANHWIPPGVPGFDEAGGTSGFGFDFLAHPGGDPGLAHSYMRAAGYSNGLYNGPAHLVALGRRDRETRQIGGLVQQAFARVGIPLRVQLIGQTKALERCLTPRTTPAVCLDGGWVKDFNDAQTILAPLFSGRAIRAHNNDNWSLLSNPAVDDSIDSASITTGPADRAQKWADADRTITQLAPALPIIWSQYPLLSSSNVKGVADDELGLWDLSFTSLR